MLIRLRCLMIKLEEHVCKLKKMRHKLNRGLGNAFSNVLILSNVNDGEMMNDIHISLNIVT